VDPTSRAYPSGDLKASDSDRDAALAELSEHFQVGRLTAAEFDERAGQALGARTGKELTALMADLPAGPPARPEPGTNSGTGAGLRRMAGRSVTMIAVVALAGITVVAAILGNGLGLELGSGHGHGHGYAGPAPWGLILIVFLILRRRTHRRDHTRSHRDE
jgi:Domain of unknown function (DUF1707)